VSCSPQLTLKVYDVGIGGIRNKLIGVGRVDLQDKLPWSQNYKPAQQEPFEFSSAVSQHDEDEEDERKSYDADYDDEDHRPLISSYDDNLGEGSYHDEDSYYEDEKVRDLDDILEGGLEEKKGDIEEGGGGKKKEKKGDSGGKRPVKDSGVGVFGPDGLFVTDDLPQSFHDDRDESAHEKKMREIDEKMKRDKEIEEQGIMGYFFGGFDANEGAYIDHTAGMPTYKELGIKFPDDWANNEFMVGRDYWIKENGAELEDMLEFAPFETYGLFRGKGGSASQVKQVGVMKGLVVVHTTRPPMAKSTFVDIKSLRIPQEYVMRLYVIKAFNLQPQDMNGLADPYLKVYIGKHKENTVKEYKPNTLNPDFYNFFEKTVSLPGESRLKIEVFDFLSFSVFYHFSFFRCLIMIIFHLMI